MKTILEHNFKTKCHDLIGLFDGVNRMSTLKANIERQSMLDPERYKPEDYRGDAFEFFVELFLMLHPNDNRVWVYDYHPNQINDNGVDGTGKNIRSDKSAVQIKYRSEERRLLTANEDSLSNFIADAMFGHDVVKDTEDPTNFRHFVFTTADGLNFYTDQEMFKSRVKCFNYDNFRSMLDGNIIFWNRVREIVSNIQ